MATAGDILRRAYRAARVIDARSAMTATEARDGLEILNALLSEWYAVEIGLPEYSLATVDATTVLDAGDREAVALQVAQRIAGEFGTALSPQDAQNAADSFARLRLRYFQPGTMRVDLPVDAGTYNIETDE